MAGNLFSHFNPQHLDPNRVLLKASDGRQWTYRDAWSEAARVSAWLAGRGLKPGDRLTIQAAKCPAWLWLYLGCLRSGVIFHPLNEEYQRDELAFFLADAEPGVVICDPHKADLFRELTRKSSIPVETLDPAGRGSMPAAWSSGPAHTPPVTDRQADDIAVLLYSSGTTGRPKGALITHGNLATNASTLIQAWGFTSGDRLLHSLPVYHAHGLFVGVGCTLMSGGSMLFHPRFDLSAVLNDLKDATVFMGVPTHYTRLLAQSALTEKLCEGMRLFISGSAPLQAETFNAFAERTGHRILERYGMTETGMNSSNPLVGERRPGTVGKALPGIEIRIRTANDKPATPPEVGEIQLRGPNIFAGYWRQPEQTAAAFTSDGWFRTGDQGTFDDAGHLVIVGRSKDLIISGGLNVYPREVELVLDSLPGIAESAVVGAPHPDFGEGVVAVAALLPGQATDEAAVIAACRERLAAYKSPKRVFFVSALPRNAMGKVQKNELRRTYVHAFAADAALPPS